MNTSTGELRDWDEIGTDKERNRQTVSKGWVPVKRKLTPIEERERQIRLYSPCGCGSGKKFKFCCKR